ncbi:biopolymer transporter ExbD [Leptolyngbya sp. 'hensonii']|uniref:ExbD/TolR family protein n=1 Tax=Leptolyngbya sp. 'hensonii' TaxID=1922337 RepID=UPI00094FFBEF|nr:biopolymer transporter ExbD [Leptolyngbya sp. 'hensonii']OLP18968.1 biopolymer transporter ExbD [Leptolyngbya sp. 'hensonii']
MRSRNRHHSSSMPEVNLVPMMDVIMTILTFFILVSMTLTGQRAINVTLPSATAGVSEVKEPEPLIIGLSTQNQTLIDNKPVAEGELGQRIQAYLAKNPTGAVILKADKKVPYEEVAKLLGIMRDMGGERVSLAIDEQ